MKTFEQFLKEKEENPYYGKTFYHGSNVEFNKFDPKYLGQTDSGMIGIGFYFTSIENLAKQYAANAVKYRGEGEAVVMQFKVFPKKTLEIDGVSASVWQHKMKELEIPDGSMRDNTDALLKMGYDSICSFDVDNNIREFVLLKAGLEKRVS